jgi:hypothetical protein
MYEEIEDKKENENCPEGLFVEDNNDLEVSLPII